MTLYELDQDSAVKITSEIINARHGPVKIYHRREVRVVLNSNDLIDLLHVLLGSLPEDISRFQKLDPQCLAGKGLQFRC